MPQLDRLTENPMPISSAIAQQMEHSSWIRRMFEKGAELKRTRGVDNVFDYSLGNPDVEPPESVLEALRHVVASNRLSSHGYMPNAGYPVVRERMAAKLSRETGLPFTPADVFMTVGSAGACNVILKSILDPGDEVIVLMPCFSEYPFYVTNHAATMVPVETDEGFLPDVERIAAAITPRTRAIILNTPNNPSGRIYPENILRDLELVLRAAPQPIMTISDEPYKSLVYDGRGSPRWHRSSAMRPSAIPGRSRKGWRASASGIWRFLPCSPTGRSCAPPAPSPTAFWASSTRRPYGNG